MRPRLVLAALLAIALAAAVGLAGCGGSGGSAERTTTATETAAQVAPDAARPNPGGKLALQQIGGFEEPIYVTSDPGNATGYSSWSNGPAGSSWSRKGKMRSRLIIRRLLRADVSCCNGRAGPPLDRPRPLLRYLRPPLRRLHRQRRRNRKST